jgi:hypothetical protein
MHVFVFVYDLKGKSLTLTKKRETKILHKLRRVKSTGNSHILEKICLEKIAYINTEGEGAYLYQISILQVWCLCTLLVTKCVPYVNWVNVFFFSISSCKRNDSNIYGSKPNYFFDLSCSQCCWRYKAEMTVWRNESNFNGRSVLGG